MKTALCISDVGIDDSDPEKLTTTKQAALYYDKVLYIAPEHIWFNQIYRMGKQRNTLPLKIQDELLPNHNLNNFVFQNEVGLMLAAIEKDNRFLATGNEVTNEMLKAADQRLIDNYYENTLVPPIKNHELDKDEPPLSTGEEGFRAVFLKQASYYFGITKPTLILPHNIRFAQETIKDEDTDISLTLSNVELIDVNNASWEQIIELRKNKTAMKHLRNLRLFLFENYQGRTPSFIEDDLGRKLDSYYATCKDHGFQTIESTISAITTSKNLLAMGSASIFAVLTDQPIVATLAAASGGTIELLKISIGLVRRNYNLKKLRRDHDLAYIIYAND